MSKINSYDILEERINNSSQKRKREISSLKTLCDQFIRKNSLEKDILLKSLIVISYSHFEGFVRDSTKYYFEFINNLSITNNKVNTKLLSSYIQYLYSSGSHGKVDLLNEVDELLKSSKKLSFNPNFQSDPESNLKYEVLEKILARAGFDENVFIDEKVYLDNVILKNRNEYAHGDSLFSVNGDTAIEISKKIVKYIDTYRNIVLNAAASNKWEK